VDLYAENIMDHYKNPRFKGILDKSDVSVHQKEANHSCGDVLELDLQIRKNKIKKMAFHGQGCAISQSAMSILLDEIKDMTLDEILALTKEDIYEMLGVPISARRSKCANLGLLTLQNAILEFQKKPKKYLIEIVG